MREQIAPPIRLTVSIQDSTFVNLMDVMKFDASITGGLMHELGATWLEPNAMYKPVSVDLGPGDAAVFTFSLAVPADASGNRGRGPTYSFASFARPSVPHRVASEEEPDSAGQTTSKIGAMIATLAETIAKGEAPEDAGYHRYYDPREPYSVRFETAAPRTCKREGCPYPRDEEDWLGYCGAACYDMRNGAEAINSCAECSTPTTGKFITRGYRETKTSRMDDAAFLDECAMRAMQSLLDIESRRLPLGPEGSSFAAKLSRAEFIARIAVPSFFMAELMVSERARRETEKK